MMRDEGADNTSIALFEAEIANIAYSLAEGSIGGYTKAYETWRRMHNVERMFARLTRVRGRRIDIIDLGCAHGLYLFYLRNRFSLAAGSKLVGVDIDARQISLAEKVRDAVGMPEISFMTAEASRTNLPDNSFDAALCLEMIEHCAQPCALLREIRRLVRPGGTVILTTPNATNPLLAIARALKPKCPEWPVHTGNHVSVKGLREWRRIMNECEFEVATVMRGSLVCGSGHIDRHPLLFALIVIIDKAANLVPFSANWTESLTFVLRNNKK